MMRILARAVTNFQLIRSNQAGLFAAIPVRHGLVMLDRLVLSAVLESNECIPAERHQISEQKAVSGFDSILVIKRCPGVARTRGMAGEWQSHVLAAPIIPASTPFFGTRALRLRGLAVIKEESRIALKRVEHGAIGKNPGCADDRHLRFVAYRAGLDPVQESGLDDRDRLHESNRRALVHL